MKKRVLRSVLLGALLAVLALGISGCIFEPVDNLYALPILPEEYSELQTTIQTTMNEQGAEYAVINYGDNTSTVQLLDLNADGQQEMAAVFLRVTSAQEKPMRVCLFRRISDGSYQQAYMLEGDGSSINSVVYEDLDGDGIQELIISWQMSARVHILSAYRLTSAGADELMSTTYNESYMTTDLDGAAGREIMVFQQSSDGEGENRAEYYRYQDGRMTMVSTAPLSADLQDVVASQNGKLSDATPGIYVTSAVTGGQVTDILTLEEDGLHNVTRDAESGTSLSTVRTYTDVGVADINGDGVLEVPMPVPAPALPMDQSGTYYFIYWRQFGRQGEAAVSCVTCHSVSDSWYLMLPSNWPGNITVTRDDSRSSWGERAVTFYYWPDQENDQPELFLTIYRLTGSNRYARAAMSGRHTLYNDGTTIYACLLNPDVWRCGVDETELMQRFHRITVEWSTQ